MDEWMDRCTEVTSLGLWNLEAQLSLPVLDLTSYVPVFGLLLSYGMCNHS